MSRIYSFWFLNNYNIITVISRFSQMGLKHINNFNFWSPKNTNKINFPNRKGAEVENLSVIIVITATKSVCKKKNITFVAPAPGI